MGFCAGFALAAIATALTLRLIEASGEGRFGPVYETPRTVAVQGRSLNRLIRDTVYFRLPEDAGQGVDAWYSLDVDLEMSLDPSASPEARSYVSVLTDVRAAAQIEFRTVRVGGERYVRWSTGELFTGDSSGLTSGRMLRLRFRNFLQRIGVRPGMNALTLQLEHYNGVVVTSARMLRGSKIVRGVLGPPRLGVAAEASPSQASVGEVVLLRMASRAWAYRRGA